MRTDQGSAWWVELGMGTIVCITAAVFALSHTAVGPFARVTVVFGAVPAALYVAVATTLGLKFVVSGIRQTPYGIGLKGGADGRPRDAVSVPGEKGDA